MFCENFFNDDLNILKKPNFNEKIFFNNVLEKMIYEHLLSYLYDQSFQKCNPSENRVKSLTAKLACCS